MTESLKRVMVLGGPNLGRLGLREPGIYGSRTWAEVAADATRWGAEHGLEVQVHQDDSEGGLVRLIHQAEDGCDGLILNAAAYTHTSVAVRDAVAALSIPCVEWHISNPTAREEFRSTNFLAGVVGAGVFGFGADGIFLALEGLRGMLDASPDALRAETALHSFGLRVIN